MRLLLLLSAALVFAAGARAQSGEVFVEAEDATLIGNATVATSQSGYSGTGYVTSLSADGDSLQFTVEATGAFVEIRLAVAGGGRFAQTDVFVDGEPLEDDLSGATRGDPSGAFQEIVFGADRLAAGTHTVVVHGTQDVDYLRLVPTTFPGPEAPPARLSDPEATDAARALFAFLLDEYGEHVLAAQQDIYQGAPRTAEIDYVTGVTGREPAIGGFDLIEYSPTRVACGTGRSDWPAEWVDWATTGEGPEGIVNLMWHWNAPTDLYDTDCNGPDEAGTDRQWYSGFYTRATSFDFEAALAEGPGGERYDLLLRDIDAIAAELQTFADADVPVLWRPLHEAAGGWFWWGARGPEPLVELWRLMYDRLTHAHDLHNLIWVWTYQPTGDGTDPLEWYPGDAYVDVVGVDVYAEDPETLMRGEWTTLQNEYGGRKLVALTESGTLPDMEDAADRGVWWSWFSVWNGFQREIPDERLARIYNSDVVLTRDELPDWRSYVLPTAAGARPEAGDLGLALYPNPTADSASLRLTLDAPAEVVVEVFDLTGRLVARQSLGARPGGGVSAPLALDAASGTYLVRVTAGDRVARATLTVAR